MSILVERIQRRLLKNNKNWLCAIVGATGSGKSYSALYLASKIDPNFDVTKVVFSAEEFLKLINTPKKLKKGSCIVFDEFGVGMPRREWYSVSNKMISYLLQTFRHKNLAVIFTVPSLDYIDSQALKLFHSKIITMQIDKQREVVICKWFDLDFNPRRNKEPYNKYPRIRKQDGHIVILERVAFSMPDSKLVKSYELKKNRFTKDLNLELESTLKELREKTKPKDVRSIDQLTQDMKKIMKRKNIKKPTLPQISAYLNISDHKANKVSVFLKEISPLE